LSNRADPQNGTFEAGYVELADTDRRKLRDEVTYDTMRGVEAVQWDEAIRRFQSWYNDQRQTRVVVENDLGDRAAFQTPNRFTPEYREMLYAKAQSLERGLRERWGKLLHTAMLTLTASTTDENGQPRSPVAHLFDLLESWEAVRRALSRVLDDREWEYLAILEPHESGYVHVHLGVFVKGPVVAEQFQPVMDAHLRNCPTAGREAHQIHPDDPDDDGAVAVHRAADRRAGGGGIENLGAYLAAYMAGEYAAEPSEMPQHVQAFYAVMWATGRQWFRPSNGAQELMQPDDDGDDGDDEMLAQDWSLVGIAPTGDLDDVVEVDPEAGRASVYRRLDLDSPPPD
jgi:hypothetical protein